MNISFIMSAVRELALRPAGNPFVGLSAKKVLIPTSERARPELAEGKDKALFLLPAFLLSEESFFIIFLNYIYGKKQIIHSGKRNVRPSG